MKIVRLYTGPDGESHFEDVDIPVSDRGGVALKSETIKATGIIFRESRSRDKYDWHNAPQRQFIVTLTGHVEIEISDGTKRQFGPGDIMLAEDTTGRGHLTRVLHNKPRTSIFVTLD
ncbi:hypothetical protein ACFLWW_00820 [Chloroflexota bacterium]